jgi:Tfp pilus assembly protein PilO
MKTLFSRFSKRERFLFIFTISAILCIGVYIFALEPFYKKWSQGDMELENKNAKLFKNLKLLVNKESIEKEYDRYKDYIQKAGGSEEEVAGVLKEIENTASGCGVKITSIKPKGVKQLKGYKKIDIELIAEAKLNQFLKFIYEVEGSKKLLKVERLVLSLKGSQSDLLKGTLIIRKISF